MRFILTKVLSLISLITFSQTGQIAGHIKKSDALLEYGYLYILAKQDSVVIKETIPDSTGYFKIGNLRKGLYSLVIKQIGYRDVVIDSVDVINDTANNLTLIYPPPCKFSYSNKKRPQCIGGHTDHIIPIVYGFPNQKTMDNAKRGRVYLGGCIVTNCDPRYYCTIHKKEL